MISLKSSRGDTPMDTYRFSRFHMEIRSYNLQYTAHILRTWYQNKTKSILVKVRLNCFNMFTLYDTLNDSI